MARVPTQTQVSRTPGFLAPHHINAMRSSTHLDGNNHAPRASDVQPGAGTVNRAPGFLAPHHINAMRSPPQPNNNNNAAGVSDVHPRTLPAPSTHVNMNNTTSSEHGSYTNRVDHSPEPTSLLTGKARPLAPHELVAFRWVGIKSTTSTGQSDAALLPATDGGSQARESNKVPLTGRPVAIKPEKLTPSWSPLVEKTETPAYQTPKEAVLAVQATLRLAQNITDGKATVGSISPPQGNNAAPSKKPVQSDATEVAARFETASTTTMTKATPVNHSQNLDAASTQESSSKDIPAVSASQGANFLCLTETPRAQQKDQTGIVKEDVSKIASAEAFSFEMVQMMQKKMLQRINSLEESLGALQDQHKSVDSATQTDDNIVEHGSANSSFTVSATTGDEHRHHPVHIRSKSSAPGKFHVEPHMKKPHNPVKLLKARHARYEEVRQTPRLVQLRPVTSPGPNGKTITQMVHQCCGRTFGAVPDLLEHCQTEHTLDQEHNKEVTSSYPRKQVVQAVAVTNRNNAAKVNVDPTLLELMQDMSKGLGTSSNVGNASTEVAQHTASINDTTVLKSSVSVNLSNACRQQPAPSAHMKSPKKYRKENGSDDISGQSCSSLNSTSGLGSGAVVPESPEQQINTAVTRAYQHSDDTWQDISSIDTIPQVSKAHLTSSKGSKTALRDTVDKADSCTAPGNNDTRNMQIGSPKSMAVVPVDALLQTEPDAAAAPWRPFAVRNMGPTTPVYPLNIDTFSKEMITGLLGGTQCIPGFYWSPEPRVMRGITLRERGYWLLEADFDPFAPQEPGTHGAKLSPVSQLMSGDRDETPQAEDFINVPVFVNRSGENFFMYMGSYAQYRLSDRVDYDTSMTHIPERVREYWAKALASQERPDWATRDLMQTLWPRPQYDGPLPTTQPATANSTAEPPEKIETTSMKSDKPRSILAGGEDEKAKVPLALAKYARELRAWEISSQSKVQQLTPAAIMEAFEKPDGALEPGLRLFWNYLQCVGYDEDLYTALLRAKHYPAYYLRG